MKMRKSRTYFAWTLAVCLVAAMVGCGDDDSDGNGGSTGGDEALKIGYAAALTGAGAVGDVPGRAGAEYAVEQINEEGGVNGQPVELLVKDMKSDGKTGGVVAEELLDEGVQVMLGPPFPDENLPVIQAGATQGVTTIVVTGTDPSNAITAQGNAVFAVFGDNQQAAASAEYALDQGYQTAVTVSSPDTGYTENAPKYFSETFTGGGGEVLTDVQFSVGQQDFGSVAQKIVDEQPDVVYTAMFIPDTPVFLRALRSAGYDGPVLGADGVDSQALIQVAKDAANGMVFTSHGFPEPGTELADVIQGIEDTQGEPPESPGLAGVGYDSVQLVKAAVDEAGSTDPEAIGEALRELTDVQGATGTFTFAGTDGFPTKTVTLVGVENGEFELVDQFIPENVPEVAN